MFAHSYSSGQSRVCWWNIVRSAKQYSFQTMTEGHSGESPVSDSDWKSVRSGRIPQRQNYEDRSGRSWLQELPGHDERLSADNDGRGSPKLADTWWSGNPVRRCADSWTSGHSACGQCVDVLAAIAEHHQACQKCRQTFAFGRPVLPQHWELLEVVANECRMHL